MGNCQAIEAAALVIQHPNGKIERLYWPVTASEIMRMNPGHYVSLIIPLPPLPEQDPKSVRFTRVKLLRPTDTLSLGHAYRLITTQEVLKVLKAKKHAKAKKQQQESIENLQIAQERQSSGSEREPKSHMDKNYQYQALKQERHRPRAISVNPAAMGSKSWRPSLQSISESAS
ncbi:uncharacterized protein LOC123213419 [Mangifera indica]|uniref:uncharacterized protein LOC123213419 n=1 Tax=Mangifera indica TaxID=29780 RepID=UPI001CF9E8B6|nr:uncharacterized protein LOC123213419 [Mangifera indica]